MLGEENVPEWNFFNLNESERDDDDSEHKTDVAQT